tara:strand:+ start:9559 stop:10446 length:888 start_codon:yes stop_codon:yes gene_type:complete
MKNLKPLYLNKTGNKIIDSFNLSYCRSNTTSFLDNIKDKKVLVLGSGPSATEIDWANKDWDVLVTTSYFYLVPEIIEQKPIHVTLSNQIDLGDKRLLDYLDNNPKCTIGFENLKFFQYNCNFNSLNFNSFNDSFLLITKFKEKYKDRIIYYQTFIDEEAKKVGVGARLCYPTLMAKPKSLTICGIDGFSKNPKLDPPNYFRYKKDLKAPPIIYRSFEERKHLAKDKFNELSLSEENYNMAIEQMVKNYDVFRNDFEEFGERLYKVGLHHNIPIHNLGKDKPYNMITPISKKYEKS